jgi:hypothetical protein
MSTFVAIDSSYAADIAAASSYRERYVYPAYQSQGFTMAPFFGPLARRGFVAPAAMAQAVSLLTGAGHGTYTSFTGFNLESVYEVNGYNPQEVNGKIVHFLSCENAQQLGPNLVQNGCRAYVGYDENFTFDPDSADLFFQCDAQIDIGLANRLVVGDAVTRAIAFFRQMISTLVSQGNQRAASMLEVNLSHLRSPLDGPQWGDPNAALV